MTPLFRGLGKCVFMEQDLSDQLAIPPSVPPKTQMPITMVMERVSPSTPLLNRKDIREIGRASCRERV